MANPVPEPALQPYLAFRNCSAALEFYERAFGAKEHYRLPMPDGRVAHAEMRIGNATWMLSDEWPDFGSLSAEHFGGTPVALCMYVPDVDSFVSKAETEGAKVVRPVADQFYGDRSATLMDPFGYKWVVSTHIEDVPPEELNRRMEAFFANQA